MNKREKTSDFKDITEQEENQKASEFFGDDKKLTKEEYTRINQIFGELFNLFSKEDRELTLKVLKVLKERGI